MDVVAEGLALPLDAEVDVGRRPAEGCGDMAVVEVVDRGLASPGHLQVRVRIDAAREQVLAGGIDHTVGVDRQRRADHRHALSVHQHIGDKAEVWYEGFYTRRKYDLAQPPALFSLTVRNTNPWFVSPAGQTSETVEYRLTDDTDPNSSGFENAQQNAIGFNYDLHGDGTEQVRGGVGIFAGRPPYVFISNQYGNTGVDFTRIGASFNANNRIPFVADVNNQPKTVTGATAGSFTNEIDIIDPDFKYPSVLRGNLAWDRKLPMGFYGSAEFLWSLTQNDVKFQNLNYVASPTLTGVGGRPYFLRKVSTLSDVIYLTNTTEGSSWTMS